MVQVAAWTDPDATVLRLTFPDGTVVADTVRLGEAVEPTSRPDAVGHIAEGPWAEALGAFVGRPVRVVRCDRAGGTRSKHPRRSSRTPRSTSSAPSRRRLASTLAGSGC